MTGTLKRPIFLAAALLLCAAPAAAQEPGQPPAAVLETRRDASQSEYDRLTREAKLSEERAAQIAGEIDAVRKDNATISAALVQAAKTERKLSQDIADIASRLDVLRQQETGLRDSLASRRGVLAEVLGALQRIGLNPPPAILVRPEDALASVRSSILLAAVVPELRGETEILVSDLRELSRIMGSIESEKNRLFATVKEQAAEQRRLSLLLEEKRNLQAKSEEKLAAEQERAVELASEATSLRELIDALEGEIDMARKAAEAEQARLAALAAEEAKLPPAAPSSLPGGAPFSAMTGQISLPVAGRIERSFGDNDGAGGALQGDMLATHSAAIVTSPTNASVLYAGPFRSYGQLLILDAGDDYHIVLAGMGRISVAPGQRVLAGEPVGMMSEARMASAAAFGSENAGPELYVEFRKEGKPVDPAPWWAERHSGRTENDT